MARKTRNTLAVLALVAGIVWSLPMQTGRNDSGLAATSVARTAEFTLTAFRGTLKVAGDTSSARFEQRLTNAAAEHFADQAAQFTFRPLSVVPAWWEDTTTDLLAALATMASPSATLGENGLRIRAVVADRSAAERQLQALRKRLPASFDMDAKFTEVNVGATAANLCEQQFAAMEPGAVAFEESGTALRAAAYPVLDRIVALADACRGATITITGHTDSSGDEAWNQQLSFLRAAAVASHLESRGVNPQRLILSGAGSSQPVADNATRYGRSLNRRIEIQLESTR